MPIERPESYWDKRKGFVYLSEVRKLAHAVAPDARSIIDVGSNGCAYLDWFVRASHKVSVDLVYPCRSDGVDGIVADFMDYPLAERFDLCLCLQVMEHVAAPAVFARKLLSAAEHVHDPVDETKLLSWFGRPPDVSLVAEEARKGPMSRRLICYYASHRSPLPSAFGTMSSERSRGESGNISTLQGSGANG